MLPCPGQYVKAIYDFESNYPSELNLRKGDIILVTTVVNENWLCGELRGQQGNFPVSFVSQLVLPTIRKGQKIFAATEKFFAQEKGDLDFCRGDVIVGLRAQDSNWWSGCLAGQSKNGIFPLTHVYELDNNYISFKKEQNQIVRALVDCTPQLDEELGFKAGDLITVLEMVDNDWYIGECRDKQGMFLTSCVEFLNTGLTGKTYSNPPVTSTSLSKTTAASFNLSRTSHTYNSENTRSYDSSVTPYARTLYSFTAQASNELTFGANEIILLLCHVDSQWIKGELDGKTGIFPASYVDIIVDCPHLESDLSNMSSSQSNSDKLPITSTVDCQEEECYGLVKYDFKAETSGDLNLKEGDTITILQQVDQNWFLAKKEDNEIGHCPVNHIDVVGSEPKFLLADHPHVANATAQGIGIVPRTEQKSVRNDLKDGYQDKENNNIFSNQLKHNKSSPKLLLPMVPKPSLQPKPTPKPKPVVLPKSSSPPLPTKSVHRPPRPHTISGSSSFDTHHLNSLIENEMQTDSRKSFPILDSNENMEYRCSSGEKVKLNIANQTILFESKGSASSFVSSDVQERPSGHQSDDSLSSQYENGEKSFTKPVPIRRPPPPPQRNNFSGANSVSLNERKYMRKNQALRSSSSKPSPVQGTKPSSEGKGMQRKLSERMIPSRPAPARPPPRSVPAFKQKGHESSEPNSLTQRSSLTDSGEDSCATPHDLNIRIMKTEHELEKYQASHSKLLSELAGANEEKQQRVQLDIDSISCHIKKLTEHLHLMKCHLKDLESEKLIDKSENESELKKRKELEEKKRQHEQKRLKEIKQKMKEKRENVVQELLGTEHDFHYDLQLCIGYFLCPSVEKIPGVDLDVMFGNIEDICEISLKLLRSMELAAKAEFDNQLIGPCFVNLADEMKQAYGPYCKNHDDVITLLEKYEDNPQIKEYFEQRLQCMRQLTNVFDLGSILIKPIQRILKYPLLLSELLKTTDDDHPDKKEIQVAIDSMTDVAKSINEYKRRKDLVFKYKKDSDETFSEKIAKLSLHSIKKKSTRMKGRLSSNLGISLQTKDEEFEKIEYQFRSIEKVIKVFLRDIEAYLKQLDEYVICWENLCSGLDNIYNESQPEELKYYAEATKVVCSQYYLEFRNQVDMLVLQPLNQLLSLFLGPNKVIEKRFDKLLDYDSLARKSKLDKTNEIQAAQCDYRALNAQLLDELPRLYELSQELFQECICSYNITQANFYDKIVKKMYTLLTLPFLMSMPENILESFQALHTAAIDQLSNLDFIPRKFGPKTESKSERKLIRQSRLSLCDQHERLSSPVQFLCDIIDSLEETFNSSDGEGSETTSSKSKFYLDVMPAMSAISQEESHRIEIMQKYGKQKVYKVISHYPGLDSMDISVNVDDIVGVIKEQDPMGNKNKWFVDNGAVKGFVPKGILCHPNPGGDEENFKEVTEPHIYTEIEDKASLAANKATSEDWRHVYEQNVETESDLRLPPPPQASLAFDELYIAEYAFQSGGLNQVSLFEGQVVTVLAKQDMEGNEEWWQVDADENIGYVPAAYIRKIDATPT
ncbi:dynamin-binding protein isoform X2 [Octopus sinensis]|nr:dynamin-binding protein isoform X2 [Octopus sinensis]